MMSSKIERLQTNSQVSMGIERIDTMFAGRFLKRAAVGKLLFHLIYWKIEENFCPYSGGKSARAPPATPWPPADPPCQTLP